MIIFFGFIAFFVFLLLSYEFLRRHHKITLVVVGLLPFLLLPWWIQVRPHTWFEWAKLYSIVYGLLLMECLRWTRLGKKRWAYTLNYLNLLLNILEAVFKDFSGFSTAHYLNAAAGLLLLFPLPGPQSMKVLDNDKRDLSWDLPLSWILGYTVWNFTFVYLNYSFLNLMQLALLGVPLLIALKRNDLWLQARAYTLGIYLFLYFSGDPFLKPLYATHWWNEKVAMVLAIISFSTMIVYFIYFLFRLGQKRFRASEKQEVVPNIP